MSEKFNIATGIDLDKLGDKIVDYEDKEGKQPYIFMSTSTARATFPQWCENKRWLLEGGIGLYYGCRVFVIEDFDFGEVELR